jgi:CRP-like cAMP-binding protein
MVDEGMVSTPNLQPRGFTFNRDGFVSKAPSRETIVAHGFVAVWAISRKDIEELISNYPKLQSSLRDGLKDTRQ